MIRRLLSFQEVVKCLTDNEGIVSTVTWAFEDSSHTKMVWTLTSDISETIHWENIRYKNGSFLYDEYYTQVSVYGTHYAHGNGIRIPK